MKTLKDLADFITNNKKFVTQVHGAFGKYTIPVSDFGYDSKDRVMYLFCDEDANPISVKDLLAASYRYPKVPIVIANETLAEINEVKSFHTEYDYDDNYAICD